MAQEGNTRTAVPTNAVSLNLVNNYGIDNFNTSAVALYAPDTTDTGVFYQGNYRDANRNRFLDGVDVGSAAVTGEFTRVTSRFNLPQVATTNAVQAYIDVLSHAGALLARDPVDHRVIGNVINQLGTFIDSQNQVGPGCGDAARGQPVDRCSEQRPAPTADTHSARAIELRVRLLQPSSPFGADGRSKRTRSGANRRPPAEANEGSRPQHRLAHQPRVRGAVGATYRAALGHGGPT